MLFTNDETIRRLNSAYRNVDAPTDVLAFPQEASSADPWEAVLGDVVISLESAQRQARERQWPISRELELLLAHGILHLLGYDDETPEGLEEMMRKTQQFFGEEEKT